MTQEFICEVCGAEGSFELENGLDEDALTVLQMFDKEHRRLSPECSLKDKAELLKELIVRGEWPHTLEAGVLN